MVFSSPTPDSGVLLRGTSAARQRYGVYGLRLSTLFRYELGHTYVLRLHLRSVSLSFLVASRVGNVYLDGRGIYHFVYSLSSCFILNKRGIMML